MKIDITPEEQQLLIQTVEESTYAGKLAKYVVSILDKLAGQKTPTLKKRTKRTRK